MSITPLLSAPAEIQIHVALAITALATGPIALCRKRRDRMHKVSGYLWVTVMFGTAVSGLCISSNVMPILWGFGPIHLFSVFALFSLWQGMRAIFRRDVATHQGALRGLYWQGITIAALFTMLPGRRMNMILFGDSPEMGYVVIVLGGASLIWIARAQGARAEGA